MADLINYKCYKNDRFEVLTQDGFKDFRGLIVGENSQRVKITLTSGKELFCTPRHKVLRHDESIAYVSDLKVGDRLYNDQHISSLEDFECDDAVYELLDVKDTHAYFANGILSHQCLIIDECAFIEPHLVDEFWKSVFPIISSSKKSKVFICSTANGTENLFFKLYRGAEEETNGWVYDRIMWNEVPGRDEQWAAQTRQAIGSADAWAQEFCCEFVSTGDSSIDEELYEKLMTKICKPKIELDEGCYKIWEEPNPDRLYVAGVDTSEGIGADASVIQILDITDLRDIVQVAVYHNNKIPPLEFTNRLHDILKNWGSPLALIERNNCGAQVVDRLSNDLGYEKIVSYGNDKAHRRNIMKGMIAHTNTKYKGVLNMRYFINEAQSVTIQDELTLRELKSFVRYPNGTWKAQSGRHDDRVMSLLYALYILEKDLTERFFEIAQFDDAGKPLLIEPMDFGIEYFEKPTSIYYDNEVVGHNNNALPPVVFGMEDSQMEADMDELTMFGYKPLE